MVTLEFNHLLPLHLHKGRAADDEVWQRWSGARTAELWQAVALLCAVDPDSLTLKKARSVNYIIWRLELAVAELNHGLLDPLIRFPEEPGRSIVRFDNVRRWAQINLIGIPERYPVGGEPIDLRLLDGPAAIPPRRADQQQPAPAIPEREATASVEWAELPKPRRRRQKPNGASEYMRESELLEALPFSRATLWRRVKDGEFPAPIKLGGNLNAWKRAEVTKWSEAMEASQGKKGKRS